MTGQQLAELGERTVEVEGGMIHPVCWIRWFVGDAAGEACPDCASVLVRRARPAPPRPAPGLDREIAARRAYERQRRRQNRREARQRRARRAHQSQLATEAAGNQSVWRQ